jgi:hypothetical protein
MAPTNPWHRVRTNSDSLNRLSSLSKSALGHLSMGPSLIVTLYLFPGGLPVVGRRLGLAPDPGHPATPPAPS